jgi:predicted dehydrogenase
VAWSSYSPVFALLGCLVAMSVRADEPKVIRAGIIGLDTSHVVEFTKVFNNPDAKGELAGIRIVAAFPAGSQDLPSSRDRLAGFTKTLKDTYKVEIVDSIDALLSKVDVVFLESVDGRPHLEQVKPVLKAGKPVFIDKPVAGSLVDTIEIFDLAREHKVPCFSSSSLRFSPIVAGVKKDPKVGDVLGCLTYGPCPLQKPQFGDLFWYGIHGVEALYAVMGPGCESVTRVQTENTEVVTGVWKDGRVGTFRGGRAGDKGYGGYGLIAFGGNGIVSEKINAPYEPLLLEIARFFRTGKPPVTAEETIELVAFLEAADESKKRGGTPVKIADMIAKAREAKGKR